MVRIDSGSPVVQRPSVRFEDLETLVAEFRAGAERFGEAAASALVAHLEELGADSPEVIAALANIIPPFQLSAAAMEVFRRAAVSWGECSVKDALGSTTLAPIDLWRAHDVVETVRDVVDLWDGDNDANSLGILISRAIWSKEALGGTPTQVRRFFASFESATSTELSAAAEKMLARHGNLTPTDLRLLAARIDADETRTREEQRFVNRLGSRSLPVGGQANGLAEQIRAQLPVASVEPKGNDQEPIWSWVRENGPASQGGIRPVQLDGVELVDGDLVHRCFRVKANLETLAGHRPDPNHDGVTNPAFDAIHVAYRLSSTIALLDGLGLDASELLDPPITVWPAALGEAASASASGDLQFTTTDGALHLAADGDVVVHELGHALLRRIAPQLPRTLEADAVHEGFADALACLVADDPEVAESLGALSGHPGAGIRRIDGERSFASESTEPHARGTVYAGLFWAVRVELEASGMLQEEAQAIALKLLFASASALEQVRPTARDVWDAIRCGARSLDVTDLVEREIARRS